MTGIGTLVAITAALIVLGFIEGVFHRRNLKKIPIRIHVNGTRGKSSVTRLIAAGLREAGVKTCAKTTGTVARMIMPDGREYPVFRPARANIIEQIRIVRRAAHSGSTALIVECMAVQPNLQAVSEFGLIRATHGVITNARADHLDVMGPTEEDVAWAVCGMMPANAKVFSAESRHLHIFQQAARDRNVELVVTGPADVARIEDSLVDGFRYVEHKENIALALSVLEELRVPRHVALLGMQKAQPDPGALTVVEVDFFGRHMVFVNGFAANDPESSERIWILAREQNPDVERRVAVFNCRADRADRSRQLGSACASWPAADHYLAMGTGTYVFGRAAQSAGLDPSKISYAEGRSVEEIFEMILEVCGRSTLVMGLGNIGGQGLDLVAYFRHRSILHHAPRASIVPSFAREESGV